MLVDCLIYLAVTTVLVGLGMSLFLRSLGAANDLNRNADDIAAAVRTGERWRADLRQAAAQPVFAGTNDLELTIPQTGGVVTYRFAGEAVWRRAESEATWTRLLERVKHAAWTPVPRGSVTAWHFDLELKSKKTNAKLRPLFSFIGVAREGVQP
jgi:hypothetical protein